MERAIRDLQLASRKNLSLCCLKLARYQGCIEQCRLVLEVEPNNLKVVYRIGRAYLELRQFDSAEHYLRRAFYLDPQEREVMRALEEIEHLRQEARLTEEETRPKGSFLGVIQWLLGLLWAMMLFPFRAIRSSFFPVPAKRE
jgi:tetratricopeptide (TPR) repeat protein